MSKLMIPMTPKGVQALVWYLMAHEDDITDSINDFGDLKIVYKEIIGDDE